MPKLFKKSFNWMMTISKKVTCILAVLVMSFNTGCQHRAIEATNMEKSISEQLILISEFHQRENNDFFRRMEVDMQDVEVATNREEILGGAVGILATLITSSAREQIGLGFKLEYVDEPSWNEPYYSGFEMIIVAAFVEILLKEGESFDVKKRLVSAGNNIGIIDLEKREDNFQEAIHFYHQHLEHPEQTAEWTNNLRVILSQYVKEWREDNLDKHDAKFIPLFGSLLQSMLGAIVHHN